MIAKKLLTTFLLAAATIPFVAAAGNITATVSGENIITTCKVPPPGVDQFTLEHQVELTAVQTTYIPSLPPAILDQVTSGEKEIRSRIEYSRYTGVLNNYLFLVDPGAPMPTADNVDFANIRFAWVTANINKVILNCDPVPSVTLVGKATSGYPIFVDPAGVTYVYAFGYTPGKDPQFNNLVSVTSGLSMIFAETAPGSIKWTKKFN